MKTDNFEIASDYGSTLTINVVNENNFDTANNILHIS